MSTGRRKTAAHHGPEALYGKKGAETGPEKGATVGPVTPYNQGGAENGPTANPLQPGKSKTT